MLPKRGGKNNQLNKYPSFYFITLWFDKLTLKSHSHRRLWQLRAKATQMNAWPPSIQILFGRKGKKMEPFKVPLCFLKSQYCPWYVRHQIIFSSLISVNTHIFYMKNLDPDHSIHRSLRFLHKIYSVGIKFLDIIHGCGPSKLCVWPKYKPATISLQ